MADEQGITLILGTGGTIAGTAPDGKDRHYKAAQLGVDELVAAVPELADIPLKAVQVAQIDSKDMAWPVWLALLQAVQAAVHDPAITGVVITHGTDTLEESAWLLHLLLGLHKPVVLTAAMRPATSLEADGPANLLDAVRVARWAAGQGRQGVVAVMHGRVWAGSEVRKSHSWRIDAFDGGSASPLAVVDQGVVCDAGRAWPPALNWTKADATVVSWPGQLPPVALVFSHGDADGGLIDAWRVATDASIPRGLVVAGTGHGSLHSAVEAAMRRARDAGVVVWRSTRVAGGGILPQVSGEDEPWPSTGALTPVQARLALSLALEWRPSRCASWAKAQAEVTR